MRKRGYDVGFGIDGLGFGLLRVTMNESIRGLSRKIKESMIHVCENFRHARSLEALVSWYGYADQAEEDTCKIIP